MQPFWQDILIHLHYQGGALLGTKRTQPSKDYAGVAAALAKYKIQALLIIGGRKIRFLKFKGFF